MKDIPSMITSKAANCYYFKTGQGKVPELKCFTLSLAAQATFDRVMCNLGQL
jgi:hypothetical protein